MASNGLAGIWVRLADWVLVEADLPEPVRGTVLTQMGIRVYGALEQASETAEDGLITESAPSAADPRTPVYIVTGRVESSRVFKTNMGSGMRPAGLELVIGVGGFRFQAQVDGKTDDVATGSRGAVRGTLFVIGQYEWADFGLVDTRGDLKIEETLNQPDGGYLLRLSVPQTR